VDILSHRGYWRTPHEKNSRTAFARSFDLGFGTETDIRDHSGELVIAHDMPDGSELRLTQVLDLLGDRDLPLALNIKADGLGPLLVEAMAGRPQTRWFTFDMSAPELIRQHRLGMPIYTRRSDFEREAVLYDQAQGVWLDAFEGLWFSAKDIAAMLDDGKRVCIVSPELHGRTPDTLWSMLRKSGLYDSAIMVCTDIPEALEVDARG
jgi:hypothetical protein